MVIPSHHHQVLEVLGLVKSPQVEEYYRMVFHHQEEIVKNILEEMMFNLLKKIFVHLNRSLLILYQQFIQMFKVI